MAQTHIDYMLSKIPMGRFVEVRRDRRDGGLAGQRGLQFSTGAVFDITGGRATY
jgi:hypothetical protein